MKENSNTEDEYALQVLTREVIAEIAKSIRVGVADNGHGYKEMYVEMPDDSAAHAIAQTVLLNHFKHDIT